MLFYCLLIFFKISIFVKLFQGKQFGSRPDPRFCRAWSGSKLFAKENYQQRTPVVKEIKLKAVYLGSAISCMHAWFFPQINVFKTFFQEYHQCQTVCSQISLHIMSGLIWVQTVSKVNYQQVTLTGNTVIKGRESTWKFDFFFLKITSANIYREYILVNSLPTSVVCW